ncbi:helix-turn-helix domain-containing protein [Streptomyces sp. 1331.2]|uniref:helix-turn-helix domain-containing protein n=1 Tax=Streptomyces sp. 1331.2 TaxID=1938835 RepID=UPI000BC86F0E|nr:helix-turn-helix transcriptional regulator [Streptomyces sp. 1331.2]SOB84239.1 Helix-turn-helix domain-containing protein [Streptomyces sp. 1331.2]
MATGRMEMGPTGRMVAANLRQLREAKGLSLRALAAEVQRLGHSLSPDAINKIENGRLLGAEQEGMSSPPVRRMDVDDLVALALALGVTPNRLLLPDPSWEGEVSLAPEVTHESGVAWQWATGERPLLDPNATERVRRAETAKFTAANRLPGVSPDQVSRAMATLASWSEGATLRTVEAAKPFLSKEDEGGEGLD